MTIQTPTKPRGKREAILTPQRKQLILNLDTFEDIKLHEAQRSGKKIYCSLWTED